MRSSRRGCCHLSYLKWRGLSTSHRQAKCTEHSSTVGKSESSSEWEIKITVIGLLWNVDHLLMNYLSLIRRHTPIGYLASPTTSSIRIAFPCTLTKCDRWETTAAPGVAKQFARSVSPLIKEFSRLRWQLRHASVNAEVSNYTPIRL